MRPLVVIGDALLDLDLTGTSDRVSPDAGVPVVDVEQARVRPGGAGLAAVLAADAGREVVLIAPAGEDAAAAVLRRVLQDAGVWLCALPLRGSTVCKIRVGDRRTPLLRLDVGDGTAGPGWSNEAVAALAGASGVLVSDYGRGTTGQPAVRAFLAAAADELPVVWDPHPRGAVPVPRCALVTPNATEADLRGRRPEATATRLARRWRSAVAITLGEHGAVLAQPGVPARWVPAPDVPAGTEIDPCGAGDRFASTAAVALVAGAAPRDAVRTAVEAATAFVALGGAGAYARSIDADQLVPLLPTG